MILIGRFVSIYVSMKGVPFARLFCALLLSSLSYAIALPLIEPTAERVVLLTDFSNPTPEQPRDGPSELDSYQEGQRPAYKDDSEGLWETILSLLCIFNCSS